MQQGTNRRHSPWWHHLFWIPVGACVVIAALFLFGVLPRSAQEASPPAAQTPQAAAPAASSESSPTATLPAETLAPMPSPAAPLEPELTPVPEDLRLHKPVGERQTAYRIVAELFEGSNRLTATMQLNYTNTTGDTLYELVFRLPANAYYRVGAKGAQNEQDSYPGGYEQGGVIVSSAMLNGDIAYFATGEEEQILILPFVRELPPGESTEVFLNFVLDVPTKNGRYGRTELGYQLGNCWPILAVYQDGEWITQGYQFTGDPFYSEVAEYTVELRCPAAYEVACTGSIVAEETAGGRKTTTITGSKLREFACMLTSGMQSRRAEQGSTQLRALALSDTSAERALQHAQEALDTFLPYLGSCPYDTLTITQADMHNASGMEYPGMIFVERQLFLPGSERMLAFTIYHEIAHQWFYGLVGNDQIGAPWLDEAFASWFGFLPFAQRDAEAYAALKEEFLFYRAHKGGRIDGHVNSYANPYVYEDSVYWRGAAMIDSLLRELGGDVFYSGLSIYLQDNAYGVATKADVIAAFEAAAGRPLESWFTVQLAAPAGAGAATPADEAA